MRQNDKGYRKEEAVVRELTEADLANIYGGAKVGPASPGVTNMPNLSGIQLPFGLSMPNLSGLPSSPTGSNTPAGSNAPTGNNASNGAGGIPGLGGLLGALPLGLPSI